MGKPGYLVHYNSEHDSKTGQFTFKKAADITREARNVNNELTGVVDRFGKTKKQPRADLSKLSDQELRDILNRENMERQYDQYFNTPTEKKGAKYLKDILAISTAVGGIVVAGLTAANLGMAIHEKMNQKKGSTGKPHMSRSSSSDMNFFK